MPDPPLGDVHDTGTRPSGKGLLDMPNEVLFNIVENFQVDIESLPDFEAGEWDTYSRCGTGTFTLRILCLVSKRISDVSRSILYSSIIMTGWGEETFIRLSSLLRTVLS
jgi:hypothetical protein